MNLTKLLPVMAHNWQFAKSGLVIGNAGKMLDGSNIPFVPFVGADVKGKRFDIAVHTELHRHKDFNKAMSELAAIDFNVCILVIDEGDKSGVPVSAKRKLTHRNDNLAFYITELAKNFIKFDLTVHRNDKCIVLSKGRKFYELDDTED